MENRAIVFKAPWQVALQNQEVQAEAGENEVFVKNYYSLISPGTELACLSGNESWFALPNTPGYIGCGEILATGNNVTHLAKGDKVFTYGQHKQYYKIDLTDRYGGMCLKIPENIRPEFVPFTRIASIAMTAIRVSEIELGDYVAVIGAGAVGNMAAQLAGLQGAKVIAIDINENRLELAKKCNIFETVNSSDPDWKSKIREITNGEGVSTLIDATGIAQVITDAADVVALYGELILLGSPRAPYETNVTDLLNKIHLPAFITMKGALEWRYPSFKDEFVKHSLERNSEIIMKLIREEKLQVEPLLSHRITPKEAPAAYNGLKENKDKYIGVVIDWTK